MLFFLQSVDISGKDAYDEIVYISGFREVWILLHIFSTGLYK